MARDSLSTRKRKNLSDASDIVPESPMFADLTEKQKVFVQNFTGGKYAGNAGKSAIAAGYSARNAGPIACSLLKLSHVNAAIDAVLRAEIGAKLTIQAVLVFRKILADEKAPLKLRADCAGKVIEFSGIINRVAVEKANETGLNRVDDGPKRLGEMTRAELEQMVQNSAAILKAASAMPPQTIDGDTVQDLHKTPMEPHKTLMATRA